MDYLVSTDCMQSATVGCLLLHAAWSYRPRVFGPTNYIQSATVYVWSYKSNVSGPVDYILSQIQGKT